MINHTKDLLQEIPVKEKGGVEEGAPSDYPPSQNPIKQRGGEEDGERKCQTVAQL